MTREEAIENLKELIDTYITCHGEEDTVAVSLDNVDVEAFDMAIKALEQETVSKESYDHEYFLRKELEIKITKIEQQKPKWIPVSEGLPQQFRFVNCTCHSLIDDREDWVIDTVYIPQLSDSPYSDWGNIPMLNWGQAEVVAWMYRDIPKPYKAESEVKG